MKYLALFENFDSIKESVSFENALEDWAQSDFVRDLTGKNVLGYTEDYELDSDGDSTWIDVYDVDPAFIKKLDDNYEEAAKPFLDWVKSKGINADASIMTTDNTVGFFLEKPNFKR